MSYFFTKEVQLSFEDAIAKVTEELKKEGFGVLTEINVTTTLKNKLNVDFRPYTILGACNPPFAYKALSAEDKIGLMLPCNVVVQEKDHGIVEVSAIDPVASMQAVSNKELAPIAQEVRQKLMNVIHHL